MMAPLVALLLLILVALLVYYIYWRLFIRVSSLSHFRPGMQLRGKVVSVCDGDGFEFFHVPWYFNMPCFFHIPSEYDEKSTLRVRLAGIDAPETGKPNLGEPSQHFSSKAKKTLEKLILDKIVKVKLLRKDQYKRILATCYLEGLFITTNVNTRMVELGMACMHKGKDAIYDDYKDKLVRLEEKAKELKIGMWSRNDYVSPMQFKKEMRNRNY